MKFGIISTAKIAIKEIFHIKESKEGTLCAISSRTKDSINRFFTENKIVPGLKDEVKLYDSYLDLIKDEEIDCVYIPLPSKLKFKWIKLAMENGKHVIAEKPMYNAEEVERIRKIAKEKNVHFMDNTMFVHNLRTLEIEEKYLKENRKYLKRVHSSMNVLLNDKQNCRLKKELEEYGCVGDLGWYCVRAILWAYKYELPKDVYASIQWENEVPVSCSAILNFKNNRVADFSCSFKESNMQELHMIFSNKLIIKMNDFASSYCFNDEYIKKRNKLLKQNPRIRFDFKDNSKYTVKRNPDSKEEIKIAPECAQTTELINNFISDIKKKKKKDQKEDSVRDYSFQSLQTMKVLDAVIKSGKTKKKIEL